ncbi:UNVERIFIED_ORG: hypothetical protein J2W38_007046 [Variovorax paradoxus]|nr:hypothetical protein [Variovorax paradoxus]
MQWIHERSPQREAVQGNDDFKTRDHYYELMARAGGDTARLGNLVLQDAATLQERPEIEVLRRLVQQSRRLDFDPDVLLTSACAWALESSPQLETWKIVRRIAGHSWQIEHGLSEAMAARAQMDHGARRAYADLATQLFTALARGELSSESQRRNEARDGALSHWQAASHRLDELWWGLRGADFMMYEEEMRVLGLLSEIAPQEFQQLIAGSDNPFLVEAALVSAGVGAFSPRFAQWAACAAAAPPAFTQDGCWTGSVLLPLLLVHARNELLRSGRLPAGQQAGETEIATLTSQVTEVIEAVVGILAGRPDARGTFARWSTWLMRQVLLEKNEGFDDIRSRAFIDNALLQAIGKSMQGQKSREGQKPSISVAPEDAAPWEAWCYRCVLSSFAHDGFIAAPTFAEFVRQWQLTPENWHEREGRDLLTRAQLHLPRKDFPGLSANLLVYPLASKEGFAAGWQQLWDRAFYLREVLEFGSVDARQNTYADRADASGLLLLLGCMGLACFDQAGTRLEAKSRQPTETVVEETTEASAAEIVQQIAKEMADLHATLVTGVIEVLHVDDTIQRDRWQVLLQHMALRRVYWDQRYSAGQRTVVFTAQHEPTIQDYLGQLQASPDDLISFLHACMLNKFDIDGLRRELSDARLDLQTCVDTLERLQALRPHRYPVNRAAVAMIKPLMAHSAP